jgi:hypothetical protein
MRFFQAYWYQLYLQPTPIPPHALFQPSVTATHTTLMETDYNIHKSNSTYFADMDISRTHLFTAIIRNSIHKHMKNDKASSLEGVGAAEGTKAKHMIALGGIACNFKREIKPYQKYEMWTRVMCWDRKWFYIVTHLVKPDVAKPKGWTLQPWRKAKQGAGEVDPEKLKGAVFATAIAKYVIKKGRMTVPPEEVLVHSEMVPPKPEGWVFQGTVNGAEGEDYILPESSDAESWNWDVIEAERLRGLKYAENFVSLDGLHDFFDGGKHGALGEYADL